MTDLFVGTEGKQGDFVNTNVTVQCSGDMLIYFWRVKIRQRLTRIHIKDWHVESENTKAFRDTKWRTKDATCAIQGCADYLATYLHTLVSI